MIQICPDENERGVVFLQNTNNPFLGSFEENIKFCMIFHIRVQIFSCLKSQLNE